MAQNKLVLTSDNGNLPKEQNTISLGRQDHSSKIRFYVFLKIQKRDILWFF